MKRFHRRTEAAPTTTHGGLVTAATFIVIILFCNLAHATASYWGGALARAEWNEIEKVKHTIVVEPFSSLSKDVGLDWMSVGLAELTGDLLTTGKKVRAVKGLVNKFPPKVITPDFTITGSYQLYQNQLRVYFNVHREGAGTTPIFQTAFAITPPKSGRLFTETGRVVKDILSEIKIAHDRKALSREINATASLAAYESYIKGLEAFWRFDPNYIEVARIWFEESRKHDFYFEKPYLALANMYGCLAIQAKTAGKPFENYLEKAEYIDNLRQQAGERPSPLPRSKPKVVKKTTDMEVTNRFLKSHAHYLAGLSAVQLEKWKVAAKELEESVKLVPEDRVALRQLANVYNSLGKPEKAAEVLNR